MPHPPELVDRVAARIRDVVRVHPGPNATAALTEGRPIILSGREAEVAAYAALSAMDDTSAAEPEPGTPAVRVTRYEVSCIPGHDINAHAFTITVEERSEDRWAVLLRGHWCLGVDGTWTSEPIPSERGDEWKREHRFDLDTALRLAREEAPKITVNGHTVADTLAQARAEEEA